MTHRMVVITEGFKFGVDPCTAVASLDLFENFGLKRESGGPLEPAPSPRSVFSHAQKAGQGEHTGTKIT